jgi:hypothetical protein
MMEKDKVSYQREGVIVGNAVLYNGRYVDKHTFRAFVYNKDGEEKLANSHDEYKGLVSSGIWFSTRSEAEKIVIGNSVAQQEIEQDKETEALEKIKEIKKKAKALL